METHGSITVEALNAHALCAGCFEQLVIRIETAITTDEIICGEFIKGSVLVIILFFAGMNG
jgi:hypothetical protein